MSSLTRRPVKVVTDSEDDQSDIRTRSDFHITSRKSANGAAAGDKQEDKKKQRYAYLGLKHTLPIHTITKASVLSKEAPPENYSGFIRLGMLVLGASNIRLIIENWMKYGLLIRLPHSYIPYQDYPLSVLAWLSVPICLAITFLIEVGMSHLAKIARNAKPDFRNKVTILNNLAAAAHFMHLSFLLTYPSYIVYTKIYHPLMGSGVVIICLVTFLKLVSYTLVNQELRQLYIDGKSEDNDNQQQQQQHQGEAQYPDNINIHNLVYFFFAPTLCYQPVYPRSPEFRPTFFLKRVGELIVCLVMMYVLTEQYAKPTLANSLQALEEKNYVVIAERVLKLSSTVVVIWLLMFYALFHAYLNALSEVLRFGDRTFYLAWWNSGNLATYWRLWNRPVYLFFKRHVYIPSVQAGMSPAVCQLLVFLVSAVLHEVLVGVPTHAITGFAFWGMFGQIPLIALTRALEKWRGKDSALGNTIFWISFCVVGQPTIALLYYYQWAAAHKNITPPL